MASTQSNAQQMARESIDSGKRAAASAGAKIDKAIKLVTEAKDQKILETKKQLKETLDESMTKVEDFKEQATEAVDLTIKATEKNMQAFPFRYMAGAALVGLAVGYLLMRRK